MSDTSIAIKIAGEGTQHHASGWSSDDEAWVKQLSDSGKTIRIRIPEEADTEGHESSAAVTVLVDADDDDVEGHALSLHFPSAHEANEFRKNLMLAGLLTATLAVGAGGGAAIGIAASGIDNNEATVVSSQYAPNVGQYDPANLGGTAAAIQQAGSLGQADPANMGGTLAARRPAWARPIRPTWAAPWRPRRPAWARPIRPTWAAPWRPRRPAWARPIRPTWAAPWRPTEASLGQADPANMGGTLAQEASLGQADPANMGGTGGSRARAGRLRQHGWHAAVGHQRRGGRPAVDPARDLT